MFAFAGVLLYLYFFSTRSQPTKTAAIAPKAQYQNPLDKSSQYSNPFDKNKNPFDNLK